MKTNVNVTSIDAYQHVKAYIAGEQHRKILTAMSPGKLYTRRQLAMQLGIDTSSMAGRINELIVTGQIEVSGHVKCTISHRTVEAIKLADEQKELFV